MIEPWYGKQSQSGLLNDLCFTEVRDYGNLIDGMVGIEARAFGLNFEISWLHDRIVNVSTLMEVVTEVELLSIRS